MGNSSEWSYSVVPGVAEDAGRMLIWINVLKSQLDTPALAVLIRAAKAAVHATALALVMSPLGTF